VWRRAVRVFDRRLLVWRWVGGLQNGRITPALFFCSTAFAGMLLAFFVGSPWIG